MGHVNYRNDKFMPADLPDVCAQRSKLVGLFHQAAQRRVVFVCAPAGFGKTVSTLLWLKTSGRKTLWIELDDYDNSPAVFYKLFCTGLISLQPENGRMVEILHSPSFSASPVEHTISLLAEFTQEDMLYALVLDDMHLVANEEIRKSLPYVLKRMPHSFVTLFLSRNQLSEKYQRTVQAGQTALINEESLLFSAEEISKYFAALGCMLPPEEAEAAFNITGGWAIAVNALAKSGRMEISQSGGQILGNYIKQQLWDDWDEPLKDFMLKTCVTDEINAELCQRLTGCEDAAEFLHSLAAKNSFISRSGEHTYRYHRLFLDFLRGQAEETGFPVQELHKAAAEYYIDQEEYYIARQHAIPSGEADIIKEALLKSFQTRSMSIDEYVTFSKAFNKDLLPDDICRQYPFLYTSHMWLSYLCGQAREAEYYLDKIYHYLPQIARDFPRFLENTILLISLDHRLPFSRLIEKFTQLPQITVRSETTQGSSMTMQMPFLHRSNRDYYELADSSILPLLDDTFGALLKDKKGACLAGVAAGLLYEQDRLEEAWGKALLAEELAANIESPELAFALNIHQAAVLWAMGKDKKAEEIIQRTHDYIEQSGAHYLRPNFKAFKTRNLLMNGNMAAASQWLDNYFVTESEHLQLYKIYQHFTTARAYMALGQLDTSLEYVMKLKNLSTDYARPLDIAEALVLRAVLEWALGQRKEAQLTLEAVLIAMQPYGFVRVIADEGAGILPALKKVMAQTQKEGYDGPLDKKYVSDVYLSTYQQSKRRKGLMSRARHQPVKLSPQQKLMIELLAQGYKNADIMQKTALSINTVKAHTRLAYAKLEVNNALDAVLKARELGLID